MDDIITFLNIFSDRYPKSWLKIEDYVINLLPNENNDPFNFKSKYIKPHICKFTSDGIEYILKEKANPQEIKNTKGIFDLNLIDYEEVFKNFSEEYFSVIDWSEERLEYEINLIREFLFDCSLYKGTFFIISLNKELNNIEESLISIWNIIEPNWLQKEIVDELIVNLRHIKEVIIEDFSVLYPDLNKVFQNRKEKHTNNKMKGQWLPIAELMADGTIEIEENGTYLFKKKPIIIQSKMCKLVSEHLDGKIKPSSIKPYLTKTKHPKNSTLSEDKNIFSSKRLQELQYIASKAEKNNTLSEYFIKKIDELIKEN